MPDENSNLKSPAPAGRSTPNRRRGRRGGRGRSQGPRPTGDKAPADNSPAPEADDAADEITPPAEAAESHDAEAEADNSGGFRVPHSDVPAEFASHATAPEDHEAESASEPAAEAAPEPASQAREPRRDDRREDRREPRRDDRREDRRDERPPTPPPRVPPAQRQWVKPADFRPAEASAISEAVQHATFIANALKDLHDQMDEILELVEVADRQKLVDERELEEFRRALRRIQPQRPPQQQQYNQRGPRRDEPRRDDQRRDEPRRSAPERRTPEPRSETTSAPVASPAESPEPPPAAE